MTGDGYSGWTNYPTWCVALWIDNDRDLSDEIRAAAVRATGDYEAENEIKTRIEALNPLAGDASLWSDLMMWSLSSVNWREIAEHYRGDADDGGEEEEILPATVADLRRRYNEAVARGEESFTLDGLDFLTSYAKYVLQYLDMNNIPDSDKLGARINPQEER